MAVSAPASAAVTVASVESCAAVDCGGFSNTGGQRIALMTAGPAQWTLYLLDTAMPSEFIKVGDIFDLTIDAGVSSPPDPQRRGINQTVVLARGGSPIVFAAALAGFGQPPLPQLDAFGIHVSDEGRLCVNRLSGQCFQFPHAARIAVGTDASAVIREGQTAQVGGLSVTIGSLTEFADTGSCDGPSWSHIAGFRPL